MSDEPQTPPEQPVLSEVPTPRVIRRIERFVDNMGRMIETFTPFDPTSPFGMTTAIPDFIGQGIVTSEVMTPQGPRKQQQPFRFKIEATNIVEGFERFDAEAQKAIAAMEEEAKKQQMEQGSRLSLPPHIKRNNHKH